MKITKLFLGLIILAFTVSCGSPAEDSKEITAEQLVEGVHVEAGCGTCLFEMEGDACELAVKINGKGYFVDGATLDEFGDAHAADGLCNKTAKAHVRGEIEGDRFTAHSFELVSDDHSHSHDDGHSHEH